MAEITYFKEIVKIKSIRIKGDIVEFTLDEEFGGFLFKHHELSVLHVPGNRTGTDFRPILKSMSESGQDTITFEEPIEIMLSARGPPPKVTLTKGLLKGKK